ncbi:MAG: hypothetical protein HUU41_15205 [Bryobacteraceae bacterium]|nr:hypothetical protein [Bryobacterales bacterium]MEB2360683.1 hypothetical protein [Bryobacterales bacterium]NUN02459.1 hypothetical protein [Bryobacteraceae bacterium]
MKILRGVYHFAVLAAGVLLFSGMLVGGEKKLMHCFYFTAIESATQADWDAFHKATDQLTKQIPGLTHVWYGKLIRPMAQFNPDAEARKKFDDRTNSATGQFSRRIRGHGVCMEMNDQQTLKTYANHPAHKEWEKVYAKVRQPGTMTFDLIGE